MARRKARIPQGKKIQPAPLTLTFGLYVPENQTSQDHYISLSQCASLVNRRFYRAGLEWAVSGFTIQGTSDAGQTGYVRIYKIPDTWVATNAWEKGFHNWQRLNDEATEESPSVKAKFTDYKVYMDADHHSKGVDLNLIPLAETPIDPAVNMSYKGSFLLGEWEMSKQVVPKTDGTDGVNNFEIIWTGQNYPGGGASGLNAVSLIEGYAASRGLPDIRDPNAPADAADADGATPENWMSATFNEGTTQDDRVIADLISENNQAPYPFENATVDGVTYTDTMYPGGANNGGGLQIHDIVSITSTTVGGLSYAPGGNFKGGLIKIQTTGDLTADSAVLFQVHLTPGPHRGYMARPMQDV